MLAAITRDQLLDLVRKRVPAAWLEQLLSTADGQAVLEMLLAIYVETDARDAAEWAEHYVQPHSRQVGPPAAGAEYATTTVGITRRRQGGPHTLPAGSLVETRDGHVFATAAPLSFGGNELGVEKTAPATAVVAGWPGVIPPGEVTSFTRVANGITGAGLSVALAQAGGPAQPKSLKFRTDITKPHPFKASMLGLYLEVLDVSTVLAAGNVGRTVQLVAMNDGTALATVGAPENEYAWSPAIDTTTDASYSVWYVGPHTFTWALRDWSDLGYVVRNTTRVVGGRVPWLDEAAKTRGRPRQAGETTDALRARLARQPSGPFPVPALRKLLPVLNQFGFNRHDVRVYELGAVASDPAVDLYAENFPAAAGFIDDLHCDDMSTPETPDGMASVDPAYAPLSPFFNPGLALEYDLSSRWGAIVRWDAPGGFPAPLVATVRRLLAAAFRDATQPGLLRRIYYPTQWSFP